MKYLLPFSALLLFAFQLIAQPTIDWYKTYDDGYHYLDGSTCAIMDNDGNVYVSGEAYNNYSRSSEYDIVTIKYSPSGQELWLRTYHNFNYDGAIKMTCDNNSIYILGLSQDSVNYNENGVVLKYDVSGNLVWAYRIGRISYFDYNPKDMFVDGNTDYIYLTGYYSNYDSSRGIITKLRKNGTLEWSRVIRYQSYKYNSFSSLTVDNSSNIIAGAYVTEGYPSNISKSLLVKVDTSGSSVWFKIDTVLYYYDLACNSQGQIIAYGLKSLTGYHSELVITKISATGTTSWTVFKAGPYNFYNYYYGFPIIDFLKVDSNDNAIVSSMIESSFERNSLSVYKINSSGNTLWQYIDSTTVFPSNIVIDQQDNTYINSIYGDQNLTNNFRLTKLNSDGNLIWKIGNIGNFSYKYKPYGLFVKDNIIITSGYSDHYLPHSDYLTIKYTQPIGIQPISSEIPDRFSLSQNYPNPFNPKTKIKFSIPSVGAQYIEPLQLIIYDILGREVAVLVNERLKAGTYEVEWNASNFPSGIYYYKITAGQFTDSKKMVLVK